MHCIVILELIKVSLFIKTISLLDLLCIFKVASLNPAVHFIRFVCISLYFSYSYGMPGLSNVIV